MLATYLVAIASEVPILKSKSRNKVAKGSRHAKVSAAKYKETGPSRGNQTWLPRSLVDRHLWMPNPIRLHGVLLGIGV